VHMLLLKLQSDMLQEKASLSYLYKGHQRPTGNGFKSPTYDIKTKSISLCLRVAPDGHKT
jgi:hypothetical protein